MTTRLRRTLWICGGVLLAACAVWLILFHYLQVVPDFYTAQAIDPAHEAEAGRDCVQRFADLISDTQKVGRWHATFSEAELNGWLHVDLPKDFAEVLSADFRWPVIQLQPKQANVGVQVQAAGTSVIYSLSFDVYRHREQVVALRLKQARAGQIPLPLRRMIHEITDIAQKSDIALQWGQIQGDPVALLDFGSGPPGSGNWELDAIEFRDHALFISGKTLSK